MQGGVYEDLRTPSRNQNKQNEREVPQCSSRFQGRSTSFNENLFERI